MTLIREAACTAARYSRWLPARVAPSFDRLALVIANCHGPGDQGAPGLASTPRHAAFLPSAFQRPGRYGYDEATTEIVAGMAFSLPPMLGAMPCLLYRPEALTPAGLASPRLRPRLVQPRGETGRRQAPITAWLGAEDARPSGFGARGRSGS